MIQCKNENALGKMTLFLTVYVSGDLIVKVTLSRKAKVRVQGRIKKIATGKK